MHVLGDESDRDTGWHRDCGQARDRPEGDAAGSLRGGEQDRGGDRDGGHCRGVAAGEGQVSIAEPPDKRFEDQLGDRDDGAGPADGEEHTRPAPGSSSSTGDRGDEDGDWCRVAQADQGSGDGLIPAKAGCEIRI